MLSKPVVFQQPASLDGSPPIANSALASLLGFESAEELIRERPAFMVGSFADPARRAEFLAALAADGTVRSFEYQIVRKDGHKTWVSASARALRNRQGELLGYEGGMKDISARRNADRLIREQRDFINRAHNAIIVTDLDQHITFWNQGAERIMGWSASETLGRKVTEFAASMPARLESLHVSGEWHGEIKLLNKAGRSTVLDARVSLICDEQGTPTARLCIAADISDKAQLEERSLHAQRVEGIGMLAAGIAHDLNNMLAPILMGVPLLEDKVTDSGGRHLLEIIGKSAERGANLVRQILAFSHRASGESRPIQLRPLIRELSNVIQQTFPKSIRYEEEIAPDLWTVEGDPIQIHQVLLNLCVNARDAMPDGGVLLLSAENQVLDDATTTRAAGGRPGAFLLVKVSDTGCGIPPSSLDRIWEPFYTTKGPHKGTGLGLSTVRGIVEKHHGFVTVTSTPNRGTVFSILLPATKDPLLASHVSFPRSSARGNGELILVVDDEGSIRDLARAALTQTGYRVLLACDGAEAVTLFARNQQTISLIITDLDMPNLDGRALVASIRNLNRDLKIVTMSGSPGSLPLAADGGAFLAKPFSVETLLTRVRESLNTPALEKS